MQKNRKDQIISVYEKDGTTKIGEFVVSAQRNTQIFTAITRAGTRSTKSTGQLISFGSRTFLNQASVKLHTDIGLASGKAEVSVDKGSSVKAGHIGVKPYLLNSAGTYNSFNTTKLSF